MLARWDSLLFHCFPITVEVGELELSKQYFRQRLGNFEDGTFFQCIKYHTILFMYIDIHIFVRNEITLVYQCIISAVLQPCYQAYMYQCSSVKPHLTVASASNSQRWQLKVFSLRYQCTPMATSRSCCFTVTRFIKPPTKYTFSDS